MLLTPRQGLIFVFFFLLVVLVGCRPACPIASCSVRKVHHHSGKIYRGQPIWKRQNPHIGQGIPRDTKENPQHNRKKNQEN
ncbi:hypothetical protein [Adhaeribacter radiodurans]|uniref:Uncharacterized protein n=1 Tax=Adhaeribacter radiodurans TaxID=2745197 RepID=A0A7L7L6Z5_9BACT|nr:hypothetical protein [Adhaeribacter radiodurans]QMU28606.1 hypothetical protein HUW48_11405 [Adhaeribacter radiodurans]